MHEITRDDIKKNLDIDTPVYIKEIYGDETGVHRDMYRVVLKQDDYAENPREWDNVCTIVSGNGDQGIGDHGYRLEKDKMKSFIENLKTQPDTYWKYIYIYDHTGQTISLTPFNDPWDSGCCGVIFVTKETLQKECIGVTDENWQQRAQQIAESEIEIYDAYISCEVYGYEIQQKQIVEHCNKTTGKKWETTEWEVADSCGGFYGSDLDKNGLIDYITSFANNPHSETTFYVDDCPSLSYDDNGNII